MLNAWKWCIHLDVCKKIRCMHLNMCVLCIAWIAFYCGWIWWKYFRPLNFAQYEAKKKKFKTKTAKRCEKINRKSVVIVQKTKYGQCNGWLEFSKLMLSQAFFFVTFDVMYANRLTCNSNKNSGHESKPTDSHTNTFDHWRDTWQVTFESEKKL